MFSQDIISELALCQGGKEANHKVFFVSDMNLCIIWYCRSKKSFPFLYRQWLY